MNIDFSDAARAELEAVHAHYLEHASPKIAGKFVESLEEAASQLVVYPEMGQSISPRLRRLVLQKFPYSLIYRVDKQRLLIVAVAAHRRKPGYWKRREGVSSSFP